jgi:acid stress-induced BolA-like protein IbaG/YrbA
MADLRTKIRRVLGEQFPGAAVQLDRPSTSGRIHGFLTWEGFVEMDQIERQRAIRQALNEKLDENERHAIGSILTATPGEVELMRAG